MYDYPNRDAINVQPFNKFCETSILSMARFYLSTMVSADFSQTNSWYGRSPQVRAYSFLQSLLNLLNKHSPFQAFGHHNDVLARPANQASYPVSVRQYRSL